MEGSITNKILVAIVSALVIGALTWGVKEVYKDLKVRIVNLEEEINGRPHLDTDGRIWTVERQEEYARYVVTYVDLKTDALGGRVQDNKEDIKFIIQQLHKQ